MEELKTLSIFCQKVSKMKSGEISKSESANNALENFIADVSKAERDLQLANKSV